MILEKQVTKLEISEKLASLGVPQTGHFMWRLCIPQDLAVLVVADIQRYDNEYHKERNRPEIQERFEKENRFYSAFTVAELGELLPATIGRMTVCTWKLDSRVGFGCSYSDEEGYHDYEIEDHDDGDAYELYEEADTEANARGKLLIYLLENKLLVLD